ncbi:D-alanyl-D-alanine carboxypeptidase [Francisella noatunensis]
MIIIFHTNNSLSISFNSVELNEKLNNSIKYHHLESALIGIKIIDSQNKAVIFSKDSNKNFMPASNTKLLTGISGLLFLGKHFKYSTAIYYDYINIIVLTISILSFQVTQVLLPGT